MNQSFQTAVPSVKYPTENPLEYYQALYKKECKAREKAEAEVVVLRQGLKIVCRTVYRIFSPYLTIRERQQAFQQLARWCESAVGRF
jgi:hypothetical protein